VVPARLRGGGPGAHGYDGGDRGWWQGQSRGFGLKWSRRHDNTETDRSSSLPVACSRRGGGAVVSQAGFVSWYRGVGAVVSKNRPSDRFTGFADTSEFWAGRFNSDKRPACPD
jgi:hypothetical protein